MLLRVVLVLLFFLALSANCQIMLKNPSFENGNIDCGNNYAPKYWNLCEPGVANCILDSIWYAQPDSAINGRYVVDIRVHNYNNSQYNGSFSQFSACIFNLGYTYSFDVFIASYIPINNPTIFPNYSKVMLEVWLGSDSCKRDQQVYLSPLLDSFWVKYTITFRPDADYRYFFFRGNVPNFAPRVGEVVIDALSPIYVVNAYELAATTPDTLYMDKKQQCINLSATASATMDSVWWEQVGVGIISHQLDAGVVCVDSNTTFIVHGIGTDSTCAGYLPSSDTVRIRFYDPTDVSSPSLNSVKVYPNPAKEYITIEAEESGTFELYNNLGQLLQIREISKTKPEAMRLHELSYGVYYYKFISRNKYELYGKLVKQ